MLNKKREVVFVKKYLCIILSVCLILLTLSSCKSKSPDYEEKTMKHEETDTSTSTTEKVPSTSTVESEEPDNNVVETVLLPLPQERVEFSFLSGAGGWRTLMFLNVDGSFNGQYLDSEMGDNDEAYPNGSAYISNFSGKFENIEKINEYSYRMTLSNIETEIATGEEWIEDGIRYVASEPYGLEQGKDFILYLPDAPVDTMSAEFLTWWPYRYEHNQKPRETLGCYGILNVTTEYGFFNVA